jgi:NAD(P)-dependent dehydrogenase (short-subunit alcohol dehydrogenase family)
MTTTDLFDLAGKRAVVTGASRGIGRAIALGYAQRGADVVCVARDENALQDVAAAADGLPGRVCSVVGDLQDVEAPAEVIAAAVERLGGLDILVNNAGSDAPTSIEKLALPEWQRVVRLNLDSAFLLTQAASPHLRDGGGKVVNVVSMLGTVAVAYDLAYVTTKTALIGFTRAVAVEWGHKGVQVNALCPGFVETAMTASNLADDATADYMRSRTPMRRWAQPEEMVGPAVFLASAASDFMTGQLLIVDGGYTAL